MNACFTKSSSGTLFLNCAPSLLTQDAKLEHYVTRRVFLIMANSAVKEVVKMMEHAFNKCISNSSQHNYNSGVGGMVGGVGSGEFSEVPAQSIFLTHTRPCASTEHQGKDT